MVATSKASLGEASVTTASRRLFSGAAWTVGAFGVVQVLRLVTNICLTHLLAPELFGTMQIVYSLWMGIELISDVGIGQSIIFSRHANEPDFYNTAWSLQLVRGVLLGFLFCLAASPVAKFYQLPVLNPLILIASVGIFVGGLTSTSRFLLQKRMKFATRAGLETIVAFISCVGPVALAWFMPNIWGLALGPLVGVSAMAVGSHIVLPDVRQKFYFCWARFVEIMSFGRWIFASSIVYFLSSNFDRLFLAKTVPLELLGTYGIARSLAEMAGAIMRLLGDGVIFPFVSAHAHLPREELSAQLAPIRLKFILVAALGFSLFAGSADVAVKILYDQRYQAATWMLPILIFGAWITILANFNESSLLGIGRPNFNVLANAAKFVFILAGLALYVPHYGVMGGVVVVAASDLCRYGPILYGQIRERFSYFWQDFIATATVIGCAALFEWLRWMAGFGTSTDAIRNLLA